LLLLIGLDPWLADGLWGSIRLGGVCRLGGTGRFR
jgi:hypothetical protein